MMTLQPSLARFKELAKAANLIAVTAEISMDLDTPVSVFCKLVGEAEGFILESVDTTHQQFGRYSFIGAEPFIRLQVFKNRLMIRENDLMKCLDGTPQETLKKYMEGFRPGVEDEELPLANGGMVGYLNYEIAATFDRVRTMTLGEDELLGQFMVCRHLVVFDALKNTARLIHLARVTEETADAAYEEAARKIAAIAERLRAPVAPAAKTAAKRGAPLDFLAKYEN
ncbi:MAG: anthranilate synthase component I, partial [Selenomonas sp.]